MSITSSMSIGHIANASISRTLQSMFPALDRDVIEDVTRAQEGNVGRAVDACLAMSG